jgi:hypothetical protein
VPRRRCRERWKLSEPNSAARGRGSRRRPLAPRTPSSAPAERSDSRRRTRSAWRSARPPWDSWPAYSPPRVEDEKLGEVSDQIKDKVKDTAQEAGERGKQVAQQAAESAKQTAQESGQRHAEELKQTAQQKAQETKRQAGT